MFGDIIFGAEVFGQNVEVFQDNHVLPQNDFIADILNRRNKVSLGGNTVWFLEINGATVITPTPFEPDPNTYRQEYYYNSIENIMYKRARSSNQNYVWIRMR